MLTLIVFLLMLPTVVANVVAVDATDAREHTMYPWWVND